nr:hypothetical protein [Maliibacterium massiliense]
MRLRKRHRKRTGLWRYIVSGLLALGVAAVSLFAPSYLAEAKDAQLLGRIQVADDTYRAYQYATSSEDRMRMIVEAQMGSEDYTMDFDSERLPRERELTEEEAREVFMRDWQAILNLLGVSWEGSDLKAENTAISMEMFTVRENRNNLDAAYWMLQGKQESGLNFYAVLDSVTGKVYMLNADYDSSKVHEGSDTTLETITAFVQQYYEAEGVDYFNVDEKNDLYQLYLHINNNAYVLTIHFSAEKGFLAYNLRAAQYAAAMGYGVDGTTEPKW